MPERLFCAPLPRWRRMAERIGSGIASSACVQQPAAQADRARDGQIEMDVVHALDASAALKNDLITAATIQGEVTLSGTVSSDASKQLAESIAAHVNGVTKVHNNLKIGDPGATRRTCSLHPGQQEMPDAGAVASAAGNGRACRLRGRLAGPGAVKPRARLRRRRRSPQQAQSIRSSRLSAAAAAYPAASAGTAAVPEHRSTGRSTQNPQYPPQYAQQNAPQPAQRRSTAPPRGPVTIPPGTLLQLRTSETVDSKQSQGRPAGAVHGDSGRDDGRRVWRFRAEPWCTAWSRRARTSVPGRSGRQLDSGADADLARPGRTQLSASRPMSSR